VLDGLGRGLQRTTSERKEKKGKIRKNI
jgi:hypothetical protein